MKKLRPNLTTSFDKSVSFSKHVIKSTDLDINNFRGELKNSSRLLSSIEDIKKSYDGAEELTTDVFHSLFKYYPELMEQNEIDPRYMISWGVIKRLISLPEYVELKISTQHDKLMSVIGTEILMYNSKDILKELILMSEEVLDEIEKALEAAKAAEAEQDPMSEEEKAAMLQSMVDEYNKWMGEDYEKPIPEIKKALKLTIKELAGITDAGSSWGLSSDPSYQKLPYAEKLNLIKSLREDKKLQKISLLAGKLKLLALKGNDGFSKRKYTHIDSVEPGRSLDKLIPMELGYLALSETKGAFMKKYVQGELMQRKYGGKVKKGKGPIVICIDSSGSMDGDREVYTKALSLTLLEASRKEKRSFFAIHFSSGRRSADLYVNSFTKNSPYSVKDALELAQYFEGGGTDYKEPLKRAMDVINNVSEFSKAEIIFLTDGQASLDYGFITDLNAWKAKKNVKISGVLIEAYSQKDGPLEKVSDEIHNIKSLALEGDDLAKRVINFIV